MFVKDIKKIIAHVPPFHMDDYIATAILYSLTGAEITFIHPQKVTREMIFSKDIALVDVGLVYNPELNNFDHHQDKNLPCSAVLIKNHFLPELGVNNFLYTIDIIDRFGFKEAERIGLCKYNAEIDKKRKIILSFPVQKAYPFILDILKKNLDYATGIDLLYKKLKQNFEKEVTQIEKNIEEEIAKFISKLDRVQIFTVENLKIGISYETLSPEISRAFDLLKIDLLIEPNAFDNNHTSIIINTSSDKANLAHALADKLMKGYEVVFVHATKFIRVLNVNIRQFAKNLEF